jgi:hypothetical protein
MYKARLALGDLNLKKEMACGLIEELHGQRVTTIVFQVTPCLRCRNDPKDR